jgi:ribonuclease D
METPPFRIGKIPVYVIDRPHDLDQLARGLADCSAFAFDCEFDRFRHAYGFSLFLLQIFDGKACYLVDPIRLPKLDPLFPVFSNPAIEKVLYSGKEDVDLMRRLGCPVRNLFDVQIASRISNHEAVSYASLVAQECGQWLDKSEQTSNWRQRPLTSSQLIYAANDVLPLLDLKTRFQAEVERIGMKDVLAEELLHFENVTTGDFVAGLNTRQRASFAPAHAACLEKFILLRDKRAQELNLPPFKIVSDEILENIVKDPAIFLEKPFERGFMSKAVAAEWFRKELIAVARQIPVGEDWVAPRVRRSEEEIAETRREKAAYENLFKPIKEQVRKTYGEVAGDFYMVGVRDVLCQATIQPHQLKNYQWAMVREAARVLGLSLPPVEPALETPA